MKEELIDRIIVLTEKKVKLLKELKESLKYEKCKYHLVEDKKVFPTRYSLIDISSEETLAYGSAARINSYIKLKNINRELIHQK